MTEFTANDVTTTLNGGINGVVTTVTVTSASAFPAGGNFRIRIDDEILLVTAVSGNDFTVTRAAEAVNGAATAAAHSNGATVSLVLTAASLPLLASDTAALASTPATATSGKLFLPTDGAVIYRGDGSSWLPYGPIFPMADPPTAGWSWSNQGGASVASTHGGIRILAPATAGNSCRTRYRTAPSAPKVIRLHLRTGFGLTGTPGVGFGYRQSGDGKMVAAQLQGPSGPGVRFVVTQWTNDTTASSSPYVGTNLIEGDVPPWLFLYDDNTNIKFYWAQDPYSPRLIYSQARGSFLSGAGPDQFCFFVNCNQGTDDNWGWLLSYEELSSLPSW